MTRRLALLPAILRHPASLVVAAFALSCIGDTSGPGVARPGRFQLVPQFQNQSASGIVPVDRIHIVLRRPGQAAPVLDTTIAIPPGDTLVDLGLTVAVFTSSDTFSVTVDMLSPPPASTVQFHAGPLTVVAVPSQGSGAPPPPIPVPMVFIGTGATADSVAFTVVPASVFTSDTAFLMAVVYKSNAPVPGAPMGFSTLDPLRVTVLTPASTGATAVRGGAQRGAARVVAELPNGKKDTASVTVNLLPAAVGVVGGAGQTATVASLLPQPLVAQVKASDSVGVVGVWVKFQVTAGGGTLSADSALTDANGRASVTWTLGPGSGTQNVRATTPRLASAQATFAANANAGPVKSVQVVSGADQNGVVGRALVNAIRVRVADSLGNPVPNQIVNFVVTAGGGTVFAGTNLTAFTPC
ncbi:MAG: hypothetical protein EXR93_01525 [Gemmatimonadetes bacterium]|nr:hypothetical protein [Gemmatimonadota bacterium]